MTTMIFDLPSDLLIEILWRVPLKSMRALRLTCKTWNTISKSRSFTKMHLGQLEVKKEGESQIIVWMDNNIYLMSIVVNENPSTILLGKFTGLNQKVKIYQVFHCDGLLLFILRETSLDTKIVVWNPYSGQTRWIEPKYSHNQFPYPVYTYALGYVNSKDNKSCRSHKILRFYEDDGIFCEIYDFDSNLWKTLPQCYIWIHGLGVSLKGNTYWHVYNYEDEDEDEDEDQECIICFDFTRERFGLFLQVPVTLRYNEYLTLSSIREEKLVALVTRGRLIHYEIEVWITTKIDVKEVSLSKFLKVDTKPYCWISCLSVFIDEEKKVVIGFDRDNNLNRHTISIIGETGYLGELGLGGYCQNEKCRSTYVVCSSYVPRLVEIK